MPAIPLKSIVEHCDKTLAISSFRDWDGAFNGLQAENSGAVSRIAAAVDARRATIDRAIDQGADLLLAHHGLFWSPQHPWTGARYQLLRRVLDGNLAIYSAHLPLDAHPRLGNSVLLARGLRLRRLRPFFEAKGRTIGFAGETDLALDDLAARLGELCGAPPVVLPSGPKRCRQVGVVTGGAGAEVREAVAAGLDTFVTGEGPHWTATLAEELGVNVLYGGHYATETFGVKALAAHLSKKFRLPWFFVDYPTGL